MLWKIEVDYGQEEGKLKRGHFKVFAETEDGARRSLGNMLSTFKVVHVVSIVKDDSRA